MKVEILKLGGSVITVKREKRQPNLANIKRLTGEIARTGIKDLVVVHGGGSYGHPVAEKHDIAEGYKRASQLQGFSETHKAMIDLNSILLEHLIQKGIPAISVSPSAFIVTDDGEIVQEGFSLVDRYLEMGFMPILYGDAVLDRSRGFTILSGDQLAVRLAIELSADRIVFGGDVDGVYTDDPKVSDDARLILNLKLSELERAGLGGSTTTDVTGGMLGKIGEAADAVNNGIEVVIINAKTPDRVYNALMGKEVRGTKISR